MLKNAFIFLLLLCAGGVFFSCARYGYYSSPCNDVQCSNHGVCIDENGQASCECEEGFRAEGLTCISTSLVPCEDDSFCDDANPCTDDSCSIDHFCVHTAVADGTSCEDGSPCSSVDRCLSGMCITGITDKDSDNDGYFDAQCAGGDDCDDSNKDVNPGGVEGPSENPNCSDTLDNDCDGAIDGSDTNCISCATNAECNDNNICTTDSCLPSGTCENLAVSDGTNCNDDNACTQSDSCQAGKCVGTDPVNCTALDDCHTIGVCDTQTGLCSNPNKTDGITCNDGDACTQTDNCQAGVCVGVNPVVCTALDQCHLAGSCNSSTGICSNPLKTNGTSCSDGEGCTVSDSCQNGNCVPGANVDCSALDDQCNTGICSSISATSYNCVKNQATNGTSCSDGDGCTENDSCQNGSCISGSAVDCDGGNPCQVYTCLSTGPTTHNCNSTPLADNTSCSNSLFCDGAEICLSGICSNQFSPCKIEESCNETTDSCEPTATSMLCIGDTHSCATTSSGELKCFGRNDFGQIGNDSTTNQLTPLTVTGLSSGVLSCTARYQNSCAVSATGQAYCWGWNDFGQLGDNSTNESHTPVSVTGMTNAVQISVGPYHTCARKSDGTAWCWGSNNAGRLGDGTTVTQTTPVQVKGVGGLGFLTGVTDISAGESHSCAVKGQKVYCWGLNDRGQLGDGTNTLSTTPLLISGIPDVVQVSASYVNTCARTSAGALYCWGNNDYGVLGDGTTDDRHSPVQVLGPGGSGYLTNVIDIANTREHKCAALSDGSAYCWGYNNHQQLGDGTTTNSSYPVRVKGVGGVGFLSDVKRISGGQFYSCAIRTNHTVWCWGINYYGNIGDGGTGTRDYPTQSNM